MAPAPPPLDDGGGGASDGPASYDGEASSGGPMIASWLSALSTTVKPRLSRRFLDRDLFRSLSSKR
ncbi:hypothetical protein PspLS_05158 [Pyricularia sp. CBS 133598]|nr:hypothetical protein PspLS_05158 [Pyricularia sp. CBS 133598]